MKAEYFLQVVKPSREVTTLGTYTRAADAMAAACSALDAGYDPEEIRIAGSHLGYDISPFLVRPPE
jgi:hypothetical protein